jgi:hypothetical protein
MCLKLSVPALQVYVSNAVNATGHINLFKELYIGINWRIRPDAANACPMSVQSVFNVGVV